MGRWRVGLGYDIHPLAEGRELVLGGVRIPGERGLAGHSDADVLLHSLCDALLGAVALGDLGHHFPDSDPRYKDISSGELLRSVVLRVAEQGFRIENVDTTIVAERPRLAPHIEAMRHRVAEILDIAPERVSIKAKTHEGLDAVGRGEAIAAYAICLVEYAGERR